MQRASVGPRHRSEPLHRCWPMLRSWVGLDTGLIASAAALGRPTVGIFCDYDPALVGLTGDADAGNPGQVLAVLPRLLRPLK